MASVTISNLKLRNNESISTESNPMSENSVTFSFVEVVVLGTIHALIAISTTLVNSFVLLSFVLVRSLLSNLFNLLIVNLAFTDLLIGLFVEPFIINYVVRTR